MPALHGRRHAIQAIGLLAAALDDQPVLAVLVGIDAAHLALDPLLDQPPEEASAMLAEGGRQVGVHTEVVLVAVAQGQAVRSHEVGAHLAATD